MKAANRQMEEILSNRSKSTCDSRSMPSLVLQHAAIAPATVHEVPPIVHEALRPPGHRLDGETRTIWSPLRPRLQWGAGVCVWGPPGTRGSFMVLVAAAMPFPRRMPHISGACAKKDGGKPA